MSWKIGDELVEEFKYFGVWVDRKLRGNVKLENVAKKAEEWIGRVTWMSRMNGQVKVVGEGWSGSF